jgi:hypothetical protein
MVSRQSVTVVLNLKGTNDLGIQSSQRESSSSEGWNARKACAPQGEMRLLPAISPEEVETSRGLGGNSQGGTRESLEGGKVKRVVPPSAGETVGDIGTLRIGNKASRSVQA